MATMLELYLSSVRFYSSSSFKAHEAGISDLQEKHNSYSSRHMFCRIKMLKTQAFQALAGQCIGFKLLSTYPE